MAEGDIRVELDVFPADVRLPTGATLHDVRVTVTNLGLHIWEGVPPIARYHRERVLSLEGAFASGYGVQIEDGIVTVKRSRSCSCASTLKYYDLWPGQRRVAVRRR
jgi:hypothetical protein